LTRVFFPGDFFPVGMDLLDEKTAFIVGYARDIYTFDQQTGAFSLFAAIPNTVLSDIKILNDTTAYVIDNAFGEEDSLYAIDLKTGAWRVVATFPAGVQPAALQLASTTTAYVVGGTDANVYLVDLITGDITQVNTDPVGVPVPNSALFGVALNGNRLYTPHYGFGREYVVMLDTGASDLVVNLIGSGLTYNALYLQMLTDRLSGNSLTLANYLNANAPLWAIRPFALQADGLPFALKSASPVRNAFTTFASQNGYLASSQSLVDHSHGKRFLYQMTQKNPTETFTADASDRVQTLCKSSQKSAWGTLFGEYAREKAQMQAPEFTMSVGGGLLGYDYTTEKGDVFGAGGSYVYTHVSDAEDMGHANVNQGFVTLYTMLMAGHWYADMSVWGGYYSSANVRKIIFPSVDEKAKATIAGWQTAVHLEMGYDRITPSNSGMDWLSLEPFASGDWVGNWEGSFHEHGAKNLNMGQNSRFASILRVESGLRFHEIVRFNSGNKLIFCEKGSYAYQKAFKTGQITAFLVGSPGTFSVSTLADAQNLGVLELSVLYYRTGGFYFDVRAQGEYGEMYGSIQGMFEIGSDF